MRFPKVSLRWRVAIGLSLLILLIFAGSGYLQTHRQNEQLQEMLRARTDRLAGALGKVLTRPLWNVDFERVRNILQDVRQDPAFVFARVTLPDGREVARLGGRERSGDMVTSAVTAERGGEILGRVEIGLSTRGLESRAAGNLQWAALITVLALIILITAALLFLNRVLTPVAAITQAMIAIANRNEEVQVPYTDRPDEIGDMALAVLAAREDARVRRAYEEQLEDAREQAVAASRAKSEFLANMSHEIRTPINAILGMNQLLARTRLNAQQRDYLSKSWSASQNLLAIINDILDFSKIEAGQLDIETTDFTYDRVLTDVANVVGLKAQEKNLELVFHTDPAVPPALRGDPVRLGQILLNLTGNAVKFTSEGEIVVHSRVAEDDGETVVLQVDVSDTGIGMTEEQQNRLFRAFSQADTSTTRRFGGTGLGLVICHRLTRLMSGAIHVQSQQGVGTTFTFTAALRHAAAGPAAIGGAPLSLRGWRVLIVEDNKSTAKAIAEIFRGWQCGVEVAESGEAARDKLAGMGAEAPPYELMICDKQLPGMDGLALAREVRAHETARVRHVMLMDTNYGDADSGRLPHVEAVDTVIQKPVTGSTIYDALLEDLGYPDAGTPPAAASDLSTAELGPLRGRRVLLVEDNEINQQVGAQLLADVGIQADLAGNGSEAIEAATQRSYDVVLMDVQMPILDGYTATKRLRESPDTAALPVIALTAHAMSGEREKCLEAGMDDYLSKPVEAEELYRTLLKWIPGEPPGASDASDTPVESAAAIAESTVAESTPESARTDQGERTVGGLPKRLPGLEIETGLRYVANKPDMYRRIAGRFTARYAGLMGDLREMMAEGRREEAHRTAHSVKNLAGTLGATSLQPVSHELELALADAEGEVPAELLDRMESHLNEVLASLAELTPEEAEETQATA
jgi:two-component system sensor histidine kinase/response regulator